MSDFVQIEKNVLLNLAKELDGCIRQGEDHDTPEGVRYVTFSDTLVNNFSSALVELAENGESSFLNPLR